MKASLVMIKADGERRDFPLKKAITIIGRMHTCDLRIPLSSISREHCQVEKRDDGIYLRDLGSSNGTYHNDRRIMEAKLDAGDTINTGPVNFTVVINGEPEELAVEPSKMPGDEVVATREEYEEAVRQGIKESETVAPGSKAKAKAAPAAAAAASAAAAVADDEDVDIQEDADADALVESADQTPVDLDVSVDDEPVSGLDVLAELEGEHHDDLASSSDVTIQDDRPDEPRSRRPSEPTAAVDDEEAGMLEPILEPDDEDDSDDAMLDKISAMDSAEISDPRSLEELRNEDPEPISDELGEDDYEKRQDAEFGDDPISALDALSAMEADENDPEDALSWMDDED